MRRGQCFQVSLYDLDGVFLAVVSAPAKTWNRTVFEQAQQRRILCNVVHDRSFCDFYYPAVVGRGPLQIAISTAGHSGALAHRLRKQLEAQFGPEWESWLRWLGEARSSLYDDPLSPKRRRTERGSLQEWNLRLSSRLRPAASPDRRKSPEYRVVSKNVWPPLPRLDRRMPRLFNLRPDASWSVCGFSYPSHHFFALASSQFSRQSTSNYVRCGEGCKYTAVAVRPSSAPQKGGKFGRRARKLSTEVSQ